MAAREFALPDLGEGLTEALVVKWLVEVGDTVDVDQPVVVVETAKVTIELPCPFGGTVSSLIAAEGETIDVGKPLIEVADGELAQTGSGNVLVGYGTTETPRRSRVSTRTPESEVDRNAAVPASSPLVRKFARDNGVDIRSVRGTGPGGLIVRADVERAIEKARGGGERAATDRRLRAAEKYTRSRQDIPHVTCWVEADAGGLISLRNSLPGVGLLALVGRVCVAALERFPQFNSTVDVEGGWVRPNSQVNLGFAAQGLNGLIVPVVRDAGTKTARQLAAELDRLTDAARRGALIPAEVTGSTFTLNNYGVFGVDGSTPILNHPEVGMLGMGRIVRKPWLLGDEVAVRHVVQLSFTFDHRVCDGADAGGFLRFVADRIEQPVTLLPLL